MTPIFTPEFELALKQAPEDEAAHGQAVAQANFYRRCLDMGQIQRIRNLYHCKDKLTKRKVWFRPKPEQELFLQEQSLRDMILKARQIGFTELAIKVGVDRGIFEPGTSQGLMADKKEKAVAELFQRVRDTFEWFSETWGALIPLDLDKNSANKIIVKAAGVEIGDGGVALPRSMQTTFEVSSDFRGRSLTDLHVSEAARVKPPLLQAAHDAVPERGRITHETTAHGRGGTFYGNWKRTREAKKKGLFFVWKPHFFPWFRSYPEPGSTLVVPARPQWTEQERHLMTVGASELSLMWRRWKIEENFQDDPDAFDEEYPSDDESCFLGGSSVVPRKYLKLLEKWVEQPLETGHLVPKGKWLEFIEVELGYVSIWEKPKLAEEYVIGADPSEGIGQDFAAAYVRRRSNGRYVARVHGQLYPEEFAETLYLLAIFYNNAHVNFEINNHGHVVKDRLVNLHNYTNLYHRREVDELTNEWKDEVGFRTTRETKERIVLNFVARLRENKLHPMDDDLVTELTNFERNDKGRLEGVDGEHDDLAMAAFLVEEMDVALGPYQASTEDYDEPVHCDPVTGYPL